MIDGRLKLSEPVAVGSPAHGSKEELRRALLRLAERSLQTAHPREELERLVAALTEPVLSGGARRRQPAPPLAADRLCEEGS